MLDSAQSPHRLVEFLTAVSAHEDAAGARGAAALLAAEEFDAEVGALVAGGFVEAAVGFGISPVPAASLLVVDPGTRVADIPGVGRCHVAAAVWEASERGLLIVARTEVEFAPQERNLLLGMARGVGLTLRMIQALQAEHERRRLLEVLLEIQRAISHRAPLTEILAAVTDGASNLLAGRRVSLMLDGQNAAALTSRECLAVPVHAGGACAGALVAAGSPDEISDADRGLLAAFAEHASLALTDARLVEAVEEAYRDAVTGLPNRTLFLERLTGALDGDRSRLAVLFVDLDRFKAVNDGHGHAAGDELLRTVAERIAGCLRAGDIAARFGGDEFAVLLQGVEPAVAESIATRIITVLRDAVTLAEGNVFIGASVGIAYGAAGEDAETLLRDADLAMYRAKNAGGRRWAKSKPSMHCEVPDRVAPEADPARLPA